MTCFLVGAGLYGILSYSMQMRRFEIGIRLAVGARGRDIVGLIVSENVQAILVGVFGCIVLLLALVDWLGEQVKEYVEWQSAPSFLVTLTLVSVVTVLTSYLPARSYITKPVMSSLRANE